MCHRSTPSRGITGFAYPRSAHGAAAALRWKDGRENDDTFTTILEYGPENDPRKASRVVFASRQTNSARGNVGELPLHVSARST
jgi:hypothetical protein